MSDTLPVSPKFAPFRRKDGRIGYRFISMWELPVYLVGDMTRERAWELYELLIDAYEQGDQVLASRLAQRMKQEGRLDYYFANRHAFE